MEEREPKVTSEPLLLEENLTQEQETRKECGLKRRGRWHDRLLDRFVSPDPTYRLNVAGVLVWSGFKWSNEGPEHEARLERLKELMKREPMLEIRQYMKVAVLALSGHIEEAEELYQHSGWFTHDAQPDTFH